MINRITYDNGRIRSGFDSFNCDDEPDMKILCDRVNEVILEQIIENDKKTAQLKLIKQVLGVVE